jgi:hypothetical protein
MSDRVDRLTKAVCNLVSRAATPMLLKKLDIHLSQVEVEQIVSELASTIGENMLKELEIRQVIAENEIVDDRGNINGAAVVQCLNEMAARARKEDRATKLRFIGYNFKNIMRQLGLMKESDGNGQTS